MLKIQKTALAVMLGTVVSGQVFAANNQDAKFNQEASYAMGVAIGADLKGIVEEVKEVVAYDKAKFLAGISDALEGKADVTKDKKIQETLKQVDYKLEQVTQAKLAAAKAEGEKYMAEFAKKEGVKKTQSGLLYRIEKAGVGEVIKPEDKVKVHYKGSLPDGTVFDSSLDRATPAEFQLNQVIPGWTEGLQLVKKGGKIELVIPPSLSYAEYGVDRAIPPNATLHFDVEVLDVIPAKK